MLTSFKEKLGIISNTNEILDLTLENRKYHTNHKFLDFFISCEKIVPSNWYIKRICGDRGIFDHNNFKYFEERGNFP
ncbi:hypothetical protein BBF96_07350 [Anoxybacter fermentans]|uniref:Uncharacterized protein n=1 Tax=Anoxybacter fermentans TaxID=1323375 RepID=A0A3S9SY87_9FIRM|nr:hypothetical protein BBF96_07350 [Anoxybacter fermentans]